MSFETYDAISVPVFVVDRLAPGSYRLVHLNPAHMKATGMTADLIGKRMTDILPERTARQVQANYEAAATRTDPFEYREVLPLPSGERWFDTTLTRVPDSVPMRIVGTAVDITDLVRREAEKTRKSGESQAEREQFIALAAHDLRSPWRSIRSIADLLREGFVDHGDGKAELINMIYELSHKADRLTEKVMTYVTSGDMSYAGDRVDLKRMAGEVLNVIDIQHQHKLTVRDCEIETDSAALQVVLRNLLDNAVKHGGKPSLNLDVDVETATDGMITLVVSDDGVGFDDAILNEREGFQRLTTGFGLRTIKRILIGRGGMLDTAPTRFSTGATLAATMPGRIVRGADEDEAAHSA